MLVASRALGLAASHGSPLPEVPVLAPLYRLGVQIREGDLVMIAGPSGGGKSTLAQWWVSEMNLPTLYFAADAEPRESISRLIAQRSGHTVDSIVEDMAGPAMDYYQSEYLDDCNLVFCFQEEPSVEDIELEMDAYVEAWDAYPKVIVVDNLMDVDAGDESYQGQLYIMQQLRNLAKRTGATVFVLAHTRGEAGSDYSMPQSRDKIANKVDQKPQLIFTLGRDGDLFRIAPVKTRNSGAQDPTGKTFITMTWLGDRASFGAFDADWHRFSGGQ